MRVLRRALGRGTSGQKARLIGPEILASIERSIGIRFRNHQLSTTALVHSSYKNDHPGHKLENNERLGFLGDAVLKLAITEQIYMKGGNRVGDLTVWRSEAERNTMLAKISRQLELGEFLLMSAYEEKTGGRDKDSLLATCLEAIIGVIFLEYGYDKAAQVVARPPFPIGAGSVWQE